MSSLAQVRADAQAGPGAFSALSLSVLVIMLEVLCVLVQACGDSTGERDPSSLPTLMLWEPMRVLRISPFRCFRRTIER